LCVANNWIVFSDLHKWSSSPTVGTRLAIVLPGKRMLRISATAEDEGKVTLRLEGRLTGQWVELLQGTCEAPLETGVKIVVDLKNVSFVDRDGFVLLRSLADHGVEIRNALPFISEQIKKAAR
jgi:ABC-type transporter Mla MlaB component